MRYIPETGEAAMKRLTARFYRNVAGNLPVREWLLALPFEDRRLVG